MNAVESDSRVQEHCALIHRWISENPVMTGNGWEPYPLSLRIVNWIKWCWRNPTEVDQTIVNSLHTQVKALEKQIEYHILANHLFANTKALAFASRFFEGASSLKWGKKASQLLTHELDEQFLDDGAHYERSPMYHCILLWDLLDLYCLYKGATESSETCLLLKVRAERALGWLNALVHPDGEIPFFNDTTFEIAPKVTQIHDYAQHLDLKCGNISLNASGFARTTKGRFTLIADVGQIAPRYQPGHAHAEAGSFELSCGEHRVFVNSGISEYGMGDTRKQQRATSAHNAVEVRRAERELNSSEVWSGFRVARRARVKAEKAVSSLQCVIEGFWHKNKMAVHKREFLLGEAGSNENEIIIRDFLLGADGGKAYFHLHPECKAQHSDSSVEVNIHGHSVQMEFSGIVKKVTLKNGYWYPAFGKAEPNLYICVEFEDKLVTKIS
nr:heparinase II/III family protein [Aliidiomarina indica]